VKYLFQRLRDDELLTSALVRTCRRAGLPVTTVMRWLTGSRKFTPGFFQICHLERIAELSSCSPACLLWEHSVFPYATAFYSDIIFEKHWVRAHSIGKVASGIASTIQNVSCYSTMRRYCPKCVAEDTAAWGEAHWRRSHNLPGVVVCVTHRCTLRGTLLSTKTARSNWSELLPHEIAGRRLLSLAPGPFDFSVADITARLLHRPTAPGVHRDAAWYRQQLVKNGLLSVGRDVNAGRFIAWARSKCQVTPERYGFSQPDARLHWLPLMVHPNNTVPFTPLKHVFLETALLLEGHPTELGWLDHVPAGLSARPTAARDAKFATRVRGVLRRTLEAGERIRVSDALTQAGCWSEFRHDRAKFPKLGEVVERLRRSAANVKPRRQQ
jgi:hypothetical protein